jgi:transposase
VVEGIIWRFRTGSPWRDLPAEFGPWQTVWKRHRRFSQDGTWDRVHAELLTQANAAGGIDWAVSVDSTINRAHQHAVSSGDVQRHQLSRAGDRQLNYALHVMAITRRRDSPGRTYYQRKPGAEKSHKEALRCLKRRHRLPHRDSRHGTLSVPRGLTQRGANLVILWW